MKKTFFTFLAISVAIISCKKETTTPVVVPDKYQTLTANSTWNYERTNKLTTVSKNYTLTSTNRDSTVNGRAYHVFTNSSGSANEYYYISGNDYYTFQNLPATLISNPIEDIYLKDNATLNTSWTQSYAITSSGVPLTITIVNTISGKALSKTVNGNVYTDVIHVTSALSASVLGIPLPAGALISDVQSYYAKKYGMIQSKNKININYSGIVSNTDEETILKSADIK